MFGSLLAGIGANLGKYFGGGILSTIGKYGGRFLGDYLDSKWLGRTKTIHRYKNVKDSFAISIAKYGSPIPLTFGRMRVPGQIIWTDRVIENANTSSTSTYFKKQHLTVENQTSELEYFVSFAIAICEGEIIDIGRVWYGEDLINLSNYKFRLYKGGEEQLPDPLMSSSSPGGHPAYRGLAYIVFEKLPLADFDDNIPQFTFEVTRKPNVKHYSSVEDLIRSMVMIPGSGEYVYDTKVQEKSIISSLGAVISNSKINSHNHYNIADSVYSLDQLQTTCSNVKWVSPVVCWFGSSMDLNECMIRPGVELRERNIRYSEEWIIGQYNRNNAYEITKDEFGSPAYGGSVNDTSIIRYLRELQTRQLKVMLNPMFFLDVKGKPWRGRLSGDSSAIKNFFERKEGYNNFILHYAHLVKNHVDAFIIGSELIGLTKVNDNNIFPAVEQLIKLARQVKQIVGPHVLVTYAADWSEYHHTEGGWFNLDPLWASDSIDFVGIDAYFPITDTASSKITTEEILNGFKSGEGYDYYYEADRKVKHKLSSEYAWKNVRYWWENNHTNPDGQITPWKPRSKPIWFTEFGFPSIDKAPNQPNLFYDYRCAESDIPYSSSGRVDFSIQRRAIRAFLEYWSTQEYVGQMFLWTWDARPYPAWPHMNIWRDGYLWEKGHWVNNKFGSCSVASVVLEISKKCGLDLDNIKVESIDQPIEGLLLSNQITALNAINLLRTSYFFDINAHDKDIISFISRTYSTETYIKSLDILKLSDNSYIESIEIPKNIILGKIDLYFIDRNNDYNASYRYINNETASYANHSSIRLPIAMSNFEADRIGEMLLRNAHYEDRIIKFVLNSINAKIRPSDFLIFNYQNRPYSVRVINVVLENLRLVVTAIVDNSNSYLKISTISNELDIKYKPIANTKLIILDLPVYLNERKEALLYAYLQSQTSMPLYAKLKNDITVAWDRISNLSPSSSIGTVAEFRQLAPPSIFHIDEISYLVISAVTLDVSISGKWSRALVGNELICFKYIEKIQNELFKISHLVRGVSGTEIYIDRHTIAEDFVLLDYGFNVIPVSEKLYNQSIDFKCGDYETSLIYENRAAKPIPPYITKQQLTGNNLELSWVCRDRDDGNWQYNPAQDKTEFIINIIGKSVAIVRQTDSSEILIDISSLDISDGYKIDIVANHS